MHERVVRLMLGTLDLALELNLRRRPDGLDLLYARSDFVIAWAASGLAAPVDAVYPKFSDDQGLQSEAAIARSLGMGGKACIDPDQLEVVRSFRDDDDVDWAGRIVDAWERSTGESQGSLASTSRC